MDHAGYFADSFNRHVKWYEERITPLSIYDVSYDGLISQLAHDCRILDVGCGPANISAYLKSKLPQLSITGIDLSPLMLEAAKARIPEGQFINMDIRNIKTLNRSFNAIILGFCIPYLDDSETATLLSDAKDMLNANGTVYLSYIQAETTTPFSSEIPVMRKHSTESISNYVHDAGLKIIRQFSVVYTDDRDNTDFHVSLLLK
jgi:ubiquinone/menaquinone biosynthesis C-methylase UbiE